MPWRQMSMIKKRDSEVFYLFSFGGGKKKKSQVRESEICTKKREIVAFSNFYTVRLYSVNTCICCHVVGNINSSVVCNFVSNQDLYIKILPYYLFHYKKKKKKSKTIQWSVSDKLKLGSNASF